MGLHHDPEPDQSPRIFPSSLQRRWWVAPCPTTTLI